MGQFDWHTDPIFPNIPVTGRYKNTQNVRRFLRDLCGANFKFDRSFMH